MMIPPSLVIPLVTLAAGLGIGWQVHSWKTVAEQAEAERQAAETYRRTVEGWSAAVQEITQDRETERRKAAADRRTFSRSLADEKAPLLECPPQVAAGGPPAADPRLSPAFVGLWNQSLAIGLPDALRPRRANGPGRSASAAGADPAEALANLADNAETCNDLRAKVLAWQAWARSIGAAK
jgi:hypothetical protein